MLLTTRVSRRQREVGEPYLSGESEKETLDYL